MATGGSTKEQLPTLSGVRVKTRKRDKDHKLDIIGFRDQIFEGLIKSGEDYDAVSKFLDETGDKADYRTYGEHLMQILLVGGLLAPGGSLVENKDDPDKPFRVDMCVLKTPNTIESMKKMSQVFMKLALWRYKYLHKKFGEELTRIVNFLMVFAPEERDRLATFVAMAVQDNLANPSILKTLKNEHLVKEGLSLAFITQVFKLWLKEKDIGTVASVLKKANLEQDIILFFPPGRQNSESCDEHFTAEGMAQIVKLRRSLQTAGHKRALRAELNQQLTEEEGPDELIATCEQHILEAGLTAVDITIMLWKCITSSLELSKKQDLAIGQALKHIKEYCRAFLPFCKTGTAQLWLVIKVQEYCFDSVTLRKHFTKIIILLYKNDVLTEQAVLKWFNEAHSPRGKREFRPQMQHFIDWLNSAEEEDEQQEEEEEEAPQLEGEGPAKGREEEEEEVGRDSVTPPLQTL